jgi:hypothetical protein
MESVALSKGMSLSEFAKLKVRLDADDKHVISNKTDSSSEESTRSQEKIINNKIKDALTRFFGSSF